MRAWSSSHAIPNVQVSKNEGFWYYQGTKNTALPYGPEEKIKKIQVELIDNDSMDETSGHRNNL